MEQNISFVAAILLLWTPEISNIVHPLTISTVVMQHPQMTFKAQCHCSGPIKIFSQNRGYAEDLKSLTPETKNQGNNHLSRRFGKTPFTIEKMASLKYGKIQSSDSIALSKSILKILCNFFKSRFPCNNFSYLRIKRFSL